MISSFRGIRQFVLQSAKLHAFGVIEVLLTYKHRAIFRNGLKSQFLLNGPQIKNI